MQPKAVPLLQFAQRRLQAAHRDTLGSGKYLLRQIQLDGEDEMSTALAKQDVHWADPPVMHSRQKELQTAQLATVESGK